jgi:hypothetical protein
MLVYFFCTLFQFVCCIKCNAAKAERLGSPKSGDKSHQGKVQLLFPKQFCSLFYPIIVLFVILFVLRTAMHRLKSSLQRQPMQNASLDHSAGQTFTATKHFQGDRVRQFQSLSKQSDRNYNIMSNVIKAKQ